MNKELIEKLAEHLCAGRISILEQYKKIRAGEEKLYDTLISIERNMARGRAESTFAFLDKEGYVVARKELK